MDKREELLDSGPIDPSDPRYTDLLSDIQGNILNDHGRDYAAHIFLTFTGDRERARQWIRDFEPAVTSANKQAADAQRRRSAGIDDIPFVGFFLSAKGYDFLGLEKVKPKESSFETGMKARGPDLNDPIEAEWDNSFKDNAIHAMILLANDDKNRVMVEKHAVEETVTDENGNRILQGLTEIATISVIEFGRMMYRNGLRDEPLEHFGYIDGISNPMFLMEDIPEDIEKWDPGARLRLALVPEITEGKPGVGSFLVFRKLEQNVQLFQQSKHNLADALSYRSNKESKDLAGALAVGRFIDGTPVTRNNGYGQPINDFDYGPFRGTLDYSRDDGRRCPLHAHIRKANPREPGSEREHRIVRRGITYNSSGNADPYKPPDDMTPPNELPQRDVGLLFMCYQSSIENQFEYLQKRMNEQKPGIDPVTGQTEPGQPVPKQRWPRKWEEPQAGTIPFSFMECVKLKGGEYFFAPSKSFMKTISQF
jgi:Dyp-type peroxidase family